MTDEVGPGRFSGRSTVVIGGGHGIGRATADRMATEGAGVLVADLDAQAAEAVAAGLPGAEHRAVEVDVRDTRSVAALVAEAGAIDVLVVVAGGDAPHGAFTETPDEVWRELLDLNLLGPVRLVRVALPLLLASRSPSIVVVSSVNALLSAGSEPYSAAKAGLTSLIGNLASDLGPDGVRINGVAPGTIRTRVWDDQGGPDRLAPIYPLRRVGEPEDVAAAIAFLASDDAGWITGHVLPVDGGLLVRNPLRS